MKKILLVFSLALIYPLPAFGQSAPAPSAKKMNSVRAERAEKIAAFRAVYPEAKIQTNPVTGVPEDLWGDISKSQTQTDPVEAAYEFFEQNKELYGMSQPRAELKLQGKVIDQYGGMVDFKQLYKGVEIYRSTLRAYFTPAGKLEGIMGGFAHVNNLSPTPLIDSASAIGIVKQDLNYTAEDEKGETEIRKRGVKELLKGISLKDHPPPSSVLTIMPVNENYRLVWEVQISKTFFDHWRYIIDAHYGDVLNKGKIDGWEHFPRSGTPGDSSSSIKKRTTTSQPNSIEKKQAPVLPLDTTKPPRRN